MAFLPPNLRRDNYKLVTPVLFPVVLKTTKSYNLAVPFARIAEPFGSAWGLRSRGDALDGAGQPHGHLRLPRRPGPHWPRRALFTFKERARTWKGRSSSISNRVAEAAGRPKCQTQAPCRYQSRGCRAQVCFKEPWAEMSGIWAEG